MSSFVPIKQKKIQQGYLYVMHSQFLPTHPQNVYKIGVTESLPQRLKQYATYHLQASFVATCPPLQNPTQKWIQTENEPVDKLDFAHYREKAVFVMLHEYRLEDNHEFFACDLATIQKAFEMVLNMSMETLATFLNIQISPSFFEQLEAVWTKMYVCQNCAQFLTHQEEWLNDKIRLAEATKAILHLQQNNQQLSLRANAVYAEMETSKKYQALAQQYALLQEKYNQLEQDYLIVEQALNDQEELEAKETYEPQSENEDELSLSSTSSTPASPASVATSDDEQVENEEEKHTTLSTLLITSTTNNNNTNNTISSNQLVNELHNHIQNEYFRRYNKVIGHLTARTYVYSLEAIRRVLQIDTILTKQHILSNISRIIEASKTKTFKTRNNWMCALKLMLDPEADATHFKILKQHLYSKLDNTPLSTQLQPQQIYNI